MMSLGNEIVNSIYEANLNETKALVRPHSHSPQPVRDSWIQAKYVRREFVDHHWNEMGHSSQYVTTSEGHQSGNFQTDFT